MFVVQSSYRTATDHVTPTGVSDVLRSDWLISQVSRCAWLIDYRWASLIIFILFIHNASIFLHYQLTL